MSQNARVAMWVPTGTTGFDIGDGVGSTALPDSISRIPTAFAPMGGGSGGGIPEAPVGDGKTYGRKDAGWVPVADFLDAPADGQRYSRRNNTWALTVSFPEAPTDGQQYARQSGGWSVVVGGGSGGLPDAPTDGWTYGRSGSSGSNDWVKVVRSDHPGFTEQIAGSLDIAVSLMVHQLATFFGPARVEGALTVLGTAICATAPTAVDHLTNKQYVDNAVAAISLDGGTF